MGEPTVHKVVLICVDTLRYDCLGACPDKPHLEAWRMAERVRTPNLDAFLAGAAYFTQCLTPAPYTPAAHASVMTGLYPNRHGIRPFYQWGLAEDVVTLAERLRGEGFMTAAVLEGDLARILLVDSGVLRGFDAIFADERDACAQCARADMPVLLFIHTFDVHWPFCWSHLPDVRAHDQERRRALDAIVRRLGTAGPDGDDFTDLKAFMDRASADARGQLGDEDAVRLFLDWYVRGVNWFDEVRWPRMVNALKRNGLYDDALIVLFSDHGEALLPDYGGVPMGHGWSLLEDVIRVPLAFHGPGWEPGRRPEQVSLTDVTPTVLESLGFHRSEPETQQKLDGRALPAGPAHPADPAPVHISETWRTMPGRNGRPCPDQPFRWLAQVGAPCEPHQVCARRGRLKVVWHPGLPLLRRFQSPRPKTAPAGAARRTWRRVRAFLSPVLPRQLKALLRRGRRLMTGPVGDGPTAPDRRTWAEDQGTDLPVRPDSPDARVFVVNLAEDPLERAPVRVDPCRMPDPYVDLWRHLQAYWSTSVQGPTINRRALQDEEIMERLRALGYAD